MKALTIKKQFIPTLALACLSGLAINNAEAAASFNSTATVTYTINSITNLTHPGNLSGLEIVGSADVDASQSYAFLTGDSAVTPTLANAGDLPLTPAIGAIYSRTFALNGLATDSGEANTSYSAWFTLAFNNTSTDVYNIDLTLSYALNSSATGDNAFTDINLSYANFAETVAGSDYINASSDLAVPATASNALGFNFSLPNQGDQEAISLNTAIGGSLIAAPVPVPSALWLFMSALLAVPGFRKRQSALTLGS